MVESLKKRVINIFNRLDKQLKTTDKPEVILLRNISESFIDDNFFYVTGLDKGLFEGCTAILYPTGGIDIIVSELESESAKKAKESDIKIYKNIDEYKKILKDNLKNTSFIGINSEGISFKEYERLKQLLPKKKFIDVSEVFSVVRSVKDKEEIYRIRKACEIADKVMEGISDIIHEGMFEYELAAEIAYLLQKNGADKPAFDIISSFGGNTAEPHYTHGSDKLCEGDFVLCDFGACFKRYNSDITRTLVFGRSNKKQRQMYETVLAAQEIGFDRIKPGVEAKKVHEAVKSFIDKSEFKGRFIHSTGHSLGLAVHDGYVGLSSECSVELEENMVLTVEPGVYLPGFGGVRIEDDVLVKKDGVEILTKAPRDFIEI